MKYIAGMALVGERHQTAKPAKCLTAPAFTGCINLLACIFVLDFTKSKTPMGAEYTSGALNYSATPVQFTCCTDAATTKRDDGSI